MAIQININEYKTNLEWSKKHPELSVRCYIRETPDGEIKIRFERISDVLTNHSDDIPGWVRVPVPEFKAKSLHIPKFILKDQEETEVELEWYADPVTGRPRKNPVQVDENGQEYFEAVVTAQGTTGRIYPPREWIGSRVRVTRID